MIRLRFTGTRTDAQAHRIDAAALLVAIYSNRPSRAGTLRRRCARTQLMESSDSDTEIEFEGGGNTTGGDEMTGSIIRHWTAQLI